MTLQTPLILPRDGGQHFDFIGTRTTVKVGGSSSGGVLTAVETLARRGFSPPLHSHEVEDELFHVTDGEIRFVSGDADQVVSAGATVWLPKQRPHQFLVLSETARFFQVTTPAQFEEFVAAVGSRQDSAELPQPGEVDPERLAKICADFRIEVLGPPLSLPA
jgi:quercetin dioxygenase-like cupin family protein